MILPPFPFWILMSGILDMAATGQHISPTPDVILVLSTTTISISDDSSYAPARHIALRPRNLNLGSLPVPQSQVLTELPLFECSPLVSSVSLSASQAIASLSQSAAQAVASAQSSASVAIASASGSAAAASSSISIAQAQASAALASVTDDIVRASSSFLFGATLATNSAQAAAMALGAAASSQIALANQATISLRASCLPIKTAAGAIAGASVGSSLLSILAFWLLTRYGRQRKTPRSEDTFSHDFQQDLKDPLYYEGPAEVDEDLNGRSDSNSEPKRTSKPWARSSQNQRTVSTGSKPVSWLKFQPRFSSFGSVILDAPVDGSHIRKLQTLSQPVEMTEAKGKVAESNSAGSATKPKSIASDSAQLSKTKSMSAEPDATVEGNAKTNVAASEEFVDSEVKGKDGEDKKETKKVPAIGIAF